MNKLIFFYRCTNPVFFSIERIFGRICERINQNHSDEFHVEEVKMPFPSSPVHILRNMLFTYKEQAAINHITGDVHYVLLACRKNRINVITIHDCVPLHKYPKAGLRYWIIKRLWYSWPVRKADKVTVISENTKRELIDLTGADPEKIKIIPNFVDPDFFPMPRIFNSAYPRILFIGSTQNKNLERMVSALSGISAILDIVGELRPEQEAILKKENVTFEQSCGLTREELLNKYRDCDLLAFPSTYEGFGLPIVEAQATGRPVLTSDISPMREIAGLAACLVDPYSENSIRQGLLRIINDGEYRRTLIELGWQNVARFKLDTIAEEYASLYKELVRRKQGT